MMLSHLTQLSAFLFFLGVVSLPVRVVTADDSEPRTRSYRPLEAKSVAIRPAGMVRQPAPEADDAESHVRRAWSHFDRREWDRATDHFLTALERDRHHVEAAEGLAMSVYQSGEYDDAHRLGRKMRELAPSVGEIIADAVVADVRYMVEQEAYDSAREFLRYFPASDPKYAEAHRLIGTADAITAALGADGDTTGVPGAETGEPLAQN